MISYLRMAIFITAVVVFSTLSNAELRMPSIFGDHMVLQQGRVVPVWGWADPGRSVHVELEETEGGSHYVRTDDEGRWQVWLPAMEASSTPRSLLVEVIGPEREIVERVEFTDVLVGEVWICSGQSNMQWTLAASGLEDIDLSSADHDQIRMYTAQRTSHPEPQDDVPGSWVVAGPDTARGLSAVAYFFGRDLQHELDVPIGLVHTSWGGSTAEAWTSRERLASMPETSPILTRFDASLQPDPDTEAFASILHDDTSWEPVELPSFFKDQGEDLDGVVWYRRHLDVPADWAGEDLELTLGPIDDADHTYFNGVLVGRGTNWQAPRRYVIDGGLVQGGPAILSIRVQDDHGLGGFSGSPDDMRLGLEDSLERMDLSGSWIRKISTQPRGRAMSMNHRPAHLLNAMIHPIVPYAMRGVIWYQGESNVGRAAQYETLFPAMIEDWRAHWRQEAFPFFFVQLAPYDYGAPEPCAELRESQAAALRLPNTGMAVTMDVGNPADIHPRRKEPVGHRLALLALDDVYDIEVESRAPAYCCLERRDDTLVLKFEDGCGPLSTRDGQAPTHFTLAGADRVFHPAVAVIDGDLVRLRCDAVPEPVAARFAWSGEAEPNLAGSCGLPVAPFRTDAWPRVTRDNF